MCCGDISRSECGAATSPLERMRRLVVCAAEDCVGKRAIPDLMSAAQPTYVEWCLAEL